MISFRSKKSASVYCLRQNSSRMRGLSIWGDQMCTVRPNVNVCALSDWAKNRMLSLKAKWTHAYCLLSRTDMSTVSQIEHNECILSLTSKVMHYAASQRERYACALSKTEWNVYMPCLERNESYVNRQSNRTEFIYFISLCAFVFHPPARLDGWGKSRPPPGFDPWNICWALLVICLVLFAVYDSDRIESVVRIFCYFT